jgi:hypothetical protein
MKHPLGEEEYLAWRYLARAYLDMQHLRIACEARLRKMDPKTPEAVKRIMEDYYMALKDEEKQFLKQVAEQLKNHPLWEWCERVKGLGQVACLTFLGFINPYEADTAGKAKAYFGLIPGVRLKSGEKANVNLEAKGRIWLVTRNVIMQRDDYYYPLYEQKKNYYLNSERQVFMDGKWVKWPPFKEIIANPKLCPKFDECAKKLEAKAERLGRKPKPPPCRLHVDSMAKRWLAALLVSHAAMLMRQAEGLDVTNYLAHRGFIPPKP